MVGRSMFQKIRARNLRIQTSGTDLWEQPSCTAAVTPSPGEKWQEHLEDPRAGAMAQDREPAGGSVLNPLRKIHGQHVLYI